MGTEIRRKGADEPATLPRREKGPRIGGTPAPFEHHLDRTPLRHQQAKGPSARVGRDHRPYGQAQGSGEGGRVQAQGSRVGRLRRACTAIPASDGSSCVGTDRFLRPCEFAFLLGVVAHRVPRSVIPQRG
jgi:hypothetical protein